MRCPYCGADGVSLGSSCPCCGVPVGHVSTLPKPEPYQSVSAEPRENIFFGILGAIAGGILGAAIILLFFQMRLMASITGLALAFLTLKGYQLMAGKLSKTGILLSLAVMLVMPFLAYFVDGGLYLRQVYGITFFESIQSIIRMIKLGLITFGDIIQDLAMIYLLTALGAYGTVSIIKDSNEN